MKKLLFSISLSSLCFLLPAQNQHFHRGSIPGELYIVSEFKDLDYMYCDIGLFHTNDHGKTLELKCSQPAVSNIGYFSPHITVDKSPGVVYMKKWSEGDTLFRSSDYGANWTAIGDQVMYNHFLSGSVEGEIYKFGQGIFISSDYGESFQFFAENPYYFICDLGIEPGQLWAKENLGGNNIDLYRMDDYSGQFEKIARVDSSLCFSTLNYFYRGANPGELYYYQAVQTIGTGVGYYSIHFSSDNGENFELRYQSETFCWGCIDIRMVSGRDEGTFYVCRKAPDYHLGAWVLEIIDYSSDTAKTFETYTHILDETVMQKEIKPPAPVISLYPNPFQQNTSIYLSLNKQENVSISVYSLNGRLVKHLLEGKLLSGKNEIEWNGKDALGNEVKNGLYFVKVKTGKASKSFKIIKK